MKLTTHTFLIGALLFVGTPTAEACSCGGSTPQENFEWSSDVFAGTVESIEDYALVIDGVEYPYYYLVLFSVSEVWKGEVQPNKFVVTKRSTSECGYQFRVGETYLVYGLDYAYDYPFAFSCTRTSRLEDAGQDLAVLGEGVVVGAESEVPTSTVEAHLAPAYPNPFCHSTSVEATLPLGGCGDVFVYDLMGRLVHTQTNVVCGTSSQTIEFSLDEQPAGVYLVELRTNEAVARREVTLLR